MYEGADRNAHNAYSLCLQQHGCWFEMQTMQDIKWTPFSIRCESFIGMPFYQG